MVVAQIVVVKMRKQGIVAQEIGATFGRFPVKAVFQVVLVGLSGNWIFVAAQDVGDTTEDIP